MPKAKPLSKLKTPPDGGMSLDEMLSELRWQYSGQSAKEVIRKAKAAGILEGFELCAIGEPKFGDFFIGAAGATYLVEVTNHEQVRTGQIRVIVRPKVEPKANV